MSSKNLLSITFAAIVLFTPFKNKAQSQEQSIGDYACATEITPAQLEYLEKTARERSVFEADKSSKSTTFIPVQSHIIRRSNGTGGLNANELSNIMLTINHYYSEIDLYFYECGPVNYIDDDNYYDFSSSDEGAISSANDVTNVINIYYFNSVISGSSSVCGYSRFPPSPDRVIMANSCALNGSTIVHELGHYFSLYHTHGKTNTGTTDEFVNGSNCNFAGDNICDTPADPNLSGRVSTTCGYTGTGVDANGQPFNPQTDNIMSYSRKQCRRLITQGQYNRVAFSVQFDRNYLFCNAPAPNAAFSANSSISCRGEVEFQDNSSSLPSNWSWDFGDGQSSSQRNPLHRYDSSGVYTVTLTTSNSNGSDTEVKSNYVTINLPASPLLNIPDSVCRNDSALLSGSSNGDLIWYSSDTSSKSIGSGSILKTGPITSDTLFFAVDKIPNPTISAGPKDNSIGGGANYSGNRHLVFDALKPFTLKKVDVYASGSGPRTFELRNFLGLVLQDTTISVGNGKQTITLNFEVPAQQDLQLGVSVTSNTDLYRNDAGTNYPYVVPGLLSIKNSSAGSGFYYYFYNWVVQEIDCISPRASVIVHVKDCTVGLESLSKLKFKIYPNPGAGLFTIETGESIAHAKVSVYNITGNLLVEKNVSGRKIKLDLSDLAPGLYYINLKENGRNTIKKLIIN